MKGPAPGCPGSPWYLDYQDLAGPRALVVSKALPAEGKTPGTTESGGGYQVARESCRRREKERKEEKKKTPSSEWSVGFRT